MLVCFGCRNTGTFSQVSTRGDSRRVEQTIHGIRKEPWIGPDRRAPGVYCTTCFELVEADLEALELIDSRVNFLPPLDFDADAMAKQLRDLRPDAEWTMLELPAQEAVYTDIPAGLSMAIREALARVGRDRLYSHQAKAIEHGLTRQHTVIATPAGSGKSLGLLMPVLDRLASDPNATAVVIYPLKALANDQMNTLSKFGLSADPWTSAATFDLDLGDGAHPITVGRYDGGTRDSDRRLIRKSARLIVTNPDMLHLILPMVRKAEKPDSGWQRVIRNLEFVVLDEVHSYQGVFGSAVSLVLRRLRRIAATYDRKPTFLTASATIGNPIRHAETLTGVEGFQLVDRDGAGRARRLVLVCNPPERRPDGSAAQPDDPAEDLGRIAPQTVAIEVIAEGALASQAHLPVRTIGFVRTRNGVFQLAKRIQGRLAELKRQEVASAVAPYAATFLSDDREQAEGKLRDGSTLAIISTNALELGIDIPDLSLAVLVGYPGQVSSFRQRIGRAGRLGEGLGVLIVGDDPLQQYIARDPESLTRLLDGSPEDVIVNPFAPEIARRFGLRPATNDLGGLAFEDAEYFGEQLVNEYLAGSTGAPDRILGDRFYWMVDDELSPTIGLRSATANESYTVMKQERKSFEPVGTIDSASAPRDAFVPAVWSGPDGETYVVTGFDLKRHEIYCEPKDTGFLTRGVVVDQVDVTTDHQPPTAVAGATLGYGRLSIVRFVVAYRELYFSGAEKSQDVENRWPPVEFETDGLYLRVPDLAFGTHDRDETMRALQHVLLSVAPVVVASDPNDFEATSAGNTLYLYDSFGGGLRLSQPAFDRFGEVVQLAHDIVAGCSCKSGCPSCVMLGRRPEGNRDLSKSGALAVLRTLKDLWSVGDNAADERGVPWQNSPSMEST